jgi:salicylate hydroxylase
VASRFRYLRSEFACRGLGAVRKAGVRKASTAGNERKSRILFAGGGLGGLTAALALLHRGFEVQVFEQAPELREVRAGVQITANGLLAVHELGKGEVVEQEACTASGKGIGP